MQSGLKKQSSMIVVLPGRVEMIKFPGTNKRQLEEETEGKGKYGQEMKEGNNELGRGKTNKK